MIRTLLALLLFYPSFHFAGNYYWTGNSGSWNDASHWALSSGGPGGAGIPGKNDNVFFDEKSFSLPGNAITITGTVSCKSMSWMGVKNIPEIAGTSPANLDIYGSLKLVPEMQFSFSGDVRFKAESSGNIIETANQMLNAQVYFDGLNGEWYVKDILFTDKNIMLLKGSLDAGDVMVHCDRFLISGKSDKGLNLSRAVLVASSEPDFAVYGNLSYTQEAIISLSKRISISASFIRGTDSLSRKTGEAARLCSAIPSQ